MPKMQNNTPRQRGPYLRVVCGLWVTLAAGFVRGGGAKGLI